METTMTHPEGLPGLVQQAMDRHGVSSHAELLAKTGADIHPVTLGKLAKGSAGRRPGRPALAALADLAGVPYEQVRELVDPERRHPALNSTVDEADAAAAAARRRAGAPTTQAEGLAGFVLMAMARHKAVSYTDLVTRTDAPIHPITLDKLASGKYTRWPNRATVEALADLAGVPYEQVRDVVDQAGQSRALASDGPDLVNRRVGVFVRDYRDALEMTQAAVAKSMQEAGFNWDGDTVRRIENGWGRELHLTELSSLARVLRFDPTEFLAVAVDPNAPTSPRRPRGKGRRRVGAFPPTLTPGLAERGQSERLPPFPPWPGQIARLEALAKDLGVSRAETLRSVIELGLEDYEEVAMSGEPGEIAETLEASRAGARQRAGGDDQ